ncbi:MAG TPA: hypothetical protein VI259_26485 [Gemmatimonadaceae bacterium]
MNFLSPVRRALLAIPVVVSTLAAQHDMSRMEADTSRSLVTLSLDRAASGTSWLPDAAPRRAIHRSLGDWMLMIHGSAFGQYDRQETLHGDTQLGVIDWEMLMASRPIAGGIFAARVMTSLEALALGRRGYPELLQSGATDAGARLANRQHPHDLWNELAATYDHGLTSSVAFSLYGGAVGEPALGPVAYMHRPSADADPFAPLGHHSQDGAHESFGVVTAGVYGERVKLEGSAFNGREPDDYRFNLDYQGARLDSYATRLTVAPSSRVTAAAWGGYVFDHDPLDPGTGMQRYGASLLTALPAAREGAWSAALVGGIDIHHHGARAHNHGTEPAKSYHVAASSLVETTYELGDRATLYGRVEQVQKSADDLGFNGADLMQLFTVRELTLGATAELVAARDLSFGVGARGTMNLLPATLEPTYGTRTPLGLSLFLRVRPRPAKI